MKDLDPEEIKARIRMKGITLTGIGRRIGVSRSTICRTLTRPFEPGERAIAHALGEHPKNIWPTRYDSFGSRRKRQPLAAYRKPARFARGGAEK